MGSATDTQLLARVVRNPGRLVLGPTNLALPFPYGGTAIGFVEQLELIWDFVYDVTRDPSSGVVTEVGRRRVEVPDLVGVAQGPAWDEDLLQGLYSKTTAYGSGSTSDVRVEGTLIPAVVPAWPGLLFAALDPTGKSVLFRRPVPRLVEKSIAFALLRKAGLPVRFTPTPAVDWATTPFYQISRLANITL